MNVSTAEFEILTESPFPDWVMKVTTQGDGFEPRAVPLIARVGSLDLEGVVASSDGTSFHGFLTAIPQTNDELSVGWMDGELQPTGITYQPPVA
jgi:hypothetical protein